MILHDRKSTLVLYLLLLSIAAFEITISYSQVVRFTVTGLGFDKDDELLTVKYTNIIVGVICGLIAFATARDRASKYIIKMLPFILLGAFGTVIGWLYDNKMHGYLSHIYNHSLLLTYSYAAYTMSPYLTEERLIKAFGRIATALLLVTTGFVVYTYANGIDWKYSLNYITIFIPAAYFIVTKRPAVVGIIMLLAVATGKRGMMLATLTTTILFYWMDKVREKKTTVTKKMVVPLLLLAGVTVVVLSFGKWDEMAEKVFANTVKRFEFLGIDDGSEQIKEATSGRDIEIGVIYDRLERDNALLTGGGFGVEYTIRSANNWTKTGSDVSLFHYWLQFGYLFGTALFLYLTVILYRTAKNAKKFRNRKDSTVYHIVTAMFAIQFVNNLSSFMTADPLLGLTLGLLFGLEERTQFVSQKAANRHIERTPGTRSA